MPCMCIPWVVFTSTVADVMRKWRQGGRGLATQRTTNPILSKSQVALGTLSMLRPHNRLQRIHGTRSPEATHQWWTSCAGSCIPAQICINIIHGLCIAQLSMRGGLKGHVLPTKNGGSVVGSHSKGWFNAICHPGPHSCNYLFMLL